MCFLVIESPRDLSDGLYIYIYIYIYILHIYIYIYYQDIKKDLKHVDVAFLNEHYQGCLKPSKMLVVK